MSRGSRSPVPQPILELQRRLTEFRSSQPRRTKLPESLWQAAVELAREYGIYRVAHPLGLDYVRLKQRLGERPARRRKAARPAFVELVAAQPAAMEGCVIEFESPGRGKMRIHWKADVAPDWTGLLRAWREAEG